MGRKRIMRLALLSEPGEFEITEENIINHFANTKKKQSQSSNISITHIIVKHF